MKVIFEDSKGLYRIIGVGENTQDCYEIIRNFLKSHNFKLYYWRVSEFNGEIKCFSGLKGEFCCYEWIDVGSHVEFFWIVGDR